MLKVIGSPKQQQQQQQQSEAQQQRISSTRYSHRRSQRVSIASVEKKTGRDAFLLIGELTVLWLCLLLLIVHLCIVPIIDDFSPAYHDLPSMETPPPAEVIRIWTDPTPPEDPPEEEEEAAPLQQISGNEGENIKTFDITSTPKNPINSTAGKLNRKWVEVTPTVASLNLENRLILENAFNVSYLSTADSRLATNETLLSSMLIMYPTTVSAIIIVSMRLTCILANDPMHKTTKWGLIIVSIGLGITIFATCVRALIYQDSIVLVVVALLAVTFILIEVVNFIFLAMKTTKNIV